MGPVSLETVAPEVPLQETEHGVVPAGAGWFGFPTYWINRTGIARDELGVAPAATLPSLSPLPGLLASAPGSPGGTR
jgi:2-haloacid dehalogenase